MKLVVPTSLQMGWIESPPYFCAASETGRDAAAQYIKTPVGSLQNHKFLPHTNGGEEYAHLPRTNNNESGFSYMLEVYVEDYIALAVPTTQNQLDHIANSVLMGIHDRFPQDDDNDKIPFRLKS